MIIFPFALTFPPYALAYAHVHAKTALMSLSTKIIVIISDSHKRESQVNAQRSNRNISTYGVNLLMVHVYV